MSSDPINPKHYKHLPAEAIEIIEAAIERAPTNAAAFHQGQVLKYLLRCWSKKGIEDLRKAKWYLDRLVDQSSHPLAEGLVGVWMPSDRTPKPSRTQPPSGYRLLGPAKDEPRQAGDIYWSLGARDWLTINAHQVEIANRDNWRACRKTQTPSAPPKRYRDPTPKDLKNGPIACEVRNCDSHAWRKAALYNIYADTTYRFMVRKQNSSNEARYAQCRIEVAE